MRLAEPGGENVPQRAVFGHFRPHILTAKTGRHFTPRLGELGAI